MRNWLINAWIHDVRSSRLRLRNAVLHGLNVLLVDERISLLRPACCLRGWLRHWRVEDVRDALWLRLVGIVNRLVLLLRLDLRRILTKRDLVVLRLPRRVHLGSAERIAASKRAA